METRLMRSHADRYIAGICGGLAVYFSIDVTLVRLVFVILAFFGGVGVVLYVVLWIIMPEEGGSHGVHTPLEKSVANEARRVREYLLKKSTVDRISTVFGWLLVVIGILLVLHKVVPWFSFDVLWPFAVLIFGIWLLWNAFPRSVEQEEKDTNKPKDE